MLKFSNHNHLGFTLIELLVVITIIGILSGLLLTIINPSFMRNKAKDAVLAGNVGKLGQAIEAYKAVTGSYPVSLPALVTETYIKAIPTDATYTYRPATGNYCLSSPSVVNTSPQGYFKFVGSCAGATTCEPRLVQVNCASDCSGSSIDYSCSI